MFARRTILLAALSATVAGVANAAANNAKRFLGKWSGAWDGQWPMSIEVLSVNGGAAVVVYTWPDGSVRESGIIVGDKLKIPNITLTLSGPNAGVAVGDFPTAHRTADVSR
jgi:hypothetical protein